MKKFSEARSLVSRMSHLGRITLSLTTVSSTPISVTLDLLHQTFISTSLLGVHHHHLRHRRV
jgi:hypothetical protein